MEEVGSKQQTVSSLRWAFYIRRSMSLTAECFYLNSTLTIVLALFDGPRCLSTSNL